VSGFDLFRRPIGSHLALRRALGSCSLTFLARNGPRFWFCGVAAARGLVGESRLSRGVRQGLTACVRLLQSAWQGGIAGPFCLSTLGVKKSGRGFGSPLITSPALSNGLVPICTFGYCSTRVRPAKRPLSTSQKHRYEEFPR